MIIHAYFFLDQEGEVLQPSPHSVRAVMLWAEIAGVPTHEIC